VARSQSRGGRRNRGAPAGGRPAAAAAAGAAGAPRTSPAPAATARKSSARPAPATRRGADPRWLIGGATAVVVLAFIAITYFSGGLSGLTGGGSGSAPVGQVTETALNGPAAPGMLAVGTPAPDLRWTLSGQSGSIAAERGHPVLLAFVATWCPHCQAEVAVLNQINQRYAGRGLKVLGVSASTTAMDNRSRASLGDMERFVREHDATYPHLFDGALVGAQRYGVRSFPSLYLVDSNGTVRFAQSGEVSEADLARVVESVLSPAT
jgi:peroxiredoxin